MPIGLETPAATAASTSAHPRRPRILLVDDEPHVLDSLLLLLRKSFDVVTADSGPLGLERLQDDGPFSVVVSDMRMPGMDGATFLARACVRQPDVVRVLLTGQTELEAAVRAINEGHVFRFLAKPCPPTTLMLVLHAAVRQHDLVTAERVLLEQTLRGSVKMLTDLLAIANPAAFGQATRAKHSVTMLLDTFKVAEKWPIEVATMLSKIGDITLPDETSEKLRAGNALTPAEHEMIQRTPHVAEELLANIPRLDQVREILRNVHTPFAGDGRGSLEGNAIPLGARILRVVLDLDALEGQEMKRGAALDLLRARRGHYDPAIIEAVADLPSQSLMARALEDRRIGELRVGMFFARDVLLDGSSLLIARGQEVTPGVLMRLRNFAAGGRIREPLQVYVPA